MKRFSLRRPLVAIGLAICCFGQVTWALAGTTGNIAGTIKDSTSGAPIAGVKIEAVSPSQTSATATDASGHFNLFSLAPDTYTLTLTKDGYQAESIPGAVVFADQNQQYSFAMQRKMKTIGIVTATAGNTGLVKSGVGGDLYNVNSTTQAAAAQLGGGGNLDNMYSAIASVPGLTVGTGGAGWNQAVVVRGQQPFTTGFEFDGVPVNRAFDNYNSSTGSNLGLQSLEVYTGGGPSSISSSGISGFINQVIKTGTFPGFASFSGSLSTPAYYNEARVEAAGATPDRSFSYYVGVSGYNQTYNTIDDQNGASFMTNGGPLQGTSCLLSCGSPVGGGIMPVCNALNQTPSQYNGLTDGCVSPFFSLSNIATPAMISDREDIVNFHFGIPHKNGSKDDIQLLWSASALRTYFFNSPAESGPGLNAWTATTTGLPYCNDLSGCKIGGTKYPYNVPHYDDAIVYNLPFGANVAPGGKLIPYQWYYQPNSPGDRGPVAPLPFDHRDLNNNDTGIGKLQWTHPFNANAFIRAYGYSFFSDWTLDGQAGAYGYDLGFSPASPNYMLITHTVGGQLQFADQINPSNLFEATGNYTFANTSRFNNTGYVTIPYWPLFGCTLQMQQTGGFPASASGPGSPCVGTSKVGYIAVKNGVYSCYDPSSGNKEACIPNASWESNPYTLANGGLVYAKAGSQAAKAGAQWSSVWNGNASGTYNTVQPQFWNGSISDEWRPNDKWVVNVALRYDDFDYGLANTNSPQNQFWGQIVQNDTCWQGQPGTMLLNPLGPGVFPPPSPVLSSTCPKGYFHPGSAFDISSPSTYNLFYWSPRYSVTFTESPDTVWRFSGGRYAEAPLTAAVQYQNTSGNATSLWAGFFNNGFTSPFHPIPGETSAQYDLSFERHIRGTDMSFKITPYYGLTSNWEQQSFIGAGFVTQIPVGRYENYGFETAFSKGDFSRPGFSGQLSFTYTHAYTQYQAGIVPNQIATLNTLIGNYNALTKAGGGAACYQLQLDNSDKAVPCSAKPIYNKGALFSTPVANPYYAESPQPLENLNGWYPGTLFQMQPNLGPSAGVFSTGYASPYSAALILNYRVRKLNVTPSFQWLSGAHYGSPMDVAGVDPRVCAQNQGSNKVGDASTSMLCDYKTLQGPGAASQFGYLYIPNPVIHGFATIGQFQEPNIAIGNMQIGYDLTPKVKLQVTLANIFHTCWGGSSGPWTSLFSPGNVYCGYATNAAYVGVKPGEGWFNGTSPYDTKANGFSPYPFQTTPFAPINPPANGVGGYFPFNAYFSANVKI